MALFNTSSHTSNYRGLVKLEGFSSHRHGYERLPHLDDLTGETLDRLASYEPRRQRIRQERKYYIRLGKKKKLRISRLLHVSRRRRKFTSFLTSIKRYSTMWIKTMIKLSMEEGSHIPNPLPLPILPSSFFNVPYYMY